MEKRNSIHIQRHPHHQEYFAFRQVFESTPSHFSLLSTSLHFSNEPFICSFISPVLGLPCRFFPNILSSSMSFKSPSLLSTCPTQFFLWHITLIRYPLSFTIVSIS